MSILESVLYVLFMTSVIFLGLQLLRRKGLYGHNYPVIKPHTDEYYRLFNIENGNVCSLCERQLNWLYGAIEEETPVALTNKRAICKSCFKTLESKVKTA